MNIDYTVTALMFPAIPLLMGVYSNRFHSLSILIRQLHDEHVYEKHIPPEWKKQFINLSGRITLLRWTILFAAFGFLSKYLFVYLLVSIDLLFIYLIFIKKERKFDFKYLISFDIFLIILVTRLEPGNRHETAFAFNSLFFE